MKLATRIAAVLCVCVASVASCQVVGDSFTVANTFEDLAITGGAQAIFGLDSATVVDPGVDIEGFIGFYDLDFTEDSLKMTLIDNSGATDLFIPAGRFDRNLFGFDSNQVLSATLDGTAELNANASV